MPVGSVHVWIFDCVSYGLHDLLIRPYPSETLLRRVSVIRSGAPVGHHESGLPYRSRVGLRHSPRGIPWPLESRQTDEVVVSPGFEWLETGKPPPGLIPMGVRVWAIRDSNPEPAD